MQHLYRKTQSTPVLEASIGRPVSNQAKGHSSCDLSSPEGQGTRHALFFLFFIFFLDRVSLCNSPGCPGTHHLVFFLGWEWGVEVGLPAASREFRNSLPLWADAIWPLGGLVTHAFCPHSQLGVHRPLVGAFGFPFSIWLKIVCTYIKLQAAHSIKPRREIFTEWSWHRARAISLIYWAIKYLPNHYRQHTAVANTKMNGTQSLRTVCETWICCQVSWHAIRTSWLLEAHKESYD